MRKANKVSFVLQGFARESERERVMESRVLLDQTALSVLFNEENWRERERERSSELSGLIDTLEHCFRFKIKLSIAFKALKWSQKTSVF